MKILQTIALLIIAFMLMTDFAISHLWSTIYLARYRDDYKALKISCTNALDHFDEAARLLDNISTELKGRMMLSAQVELFACHQHDLFRTRLLANGVSHLDLKVIDLEALTDQSVSLSATVAAYR